MTSAPMTSAQITTGYYSTSIVGLLQFLFRFNVSLANFNTRQAEIGICKLLGVPASQCYSALFTNVKVWEGSTYFQFQLAGDLAADEDILSKLTSQSDQDTLSSAIGYPVIDASSQSASASVSSPKTIAGMPEGTAIGVFVGISIGVVLIAGLIVLVILFIRKRRSSSNPRRSDSSVDLIHNSGRRNGNNMYSSSSIPTHGSNPMFGGAASLYSIGQHCEAYWSADGGWYPARIDDISGDQYYITFTQFGNGAWVARNYLR